jgi:flagellar basal-body rod protein FlgF
LSEQILNILFRRQIDSKGVFVDAVRIAALGMARDLSRMETISQNMANVLTPGYKQQIRMDQAFGAQMQAAQSATSIEPAAPAAILRLDPTGGTLRVTGRPSDVAIEGEGFFEVQLPTGTAYTRNGAMKVGLNGQLTGEGGAVFAAESGAVTMTGTPFSIDANGAIRQDGKVLAHLKVVRFTDPGQMVALGGGMYAQGGASVLLAPATNTLRAGFLENSNVNSTQEMVRMTETVRHFESMQKIMQGVDETLEKTIRKLGEF